MLTIIFFSDTLKSTNESDTGNLGEAVLPHTWDSGLILTHGN